MDSCSMKEGKLQGNQINVNQIYYFSLPKIQENTYGSRMVPCKENILSGGRHLIYLAAAT